MEEISSNRCHIHHTRIFMLFEHKSTSLVHKHQPSCVLCDSRQLREVRRHLNAGRTEKKNNAQLPFRK